MIKVLSVASLTTLPFQKMCGNCHVMDVIICSTTDVHCNACNSKSNVHKSYFFHGSIATNDGSMLLTIEGKWHKMILLMTKFEFLDLVHSKQIQLFISIHICGKFQLSPTSTLGGFQKDI